MSEEIIVEAKSVKDAIAKALKTLNLTRDHAEVHILEKGTSGFLGIGSKPAKVKVGEKKWRHPEKHPEQPKKFPKRAKDRKPEAKRGKFLRKKEHISRKPKAKFVSREPKTEHISRKPTAEFVSREPTADLHLSHTKNLQPVPQEISENAKLAKESLSTILSYFGEKNPDINVMWDSNQKRLVADFKCSDPKIIIGKEGSTLQAIQYVVTLIVSRKTNKEIPVQVDTGNYWQQTEGKIIKSLDYAVETVKRTKKDFRLDPMPPSLRRFVHRYLSQKSGIETVSEGEGRWRKVVICYKK